MNRWKRILERVERVLALAERGLAERVSVELGEADFDRTTAFRWEASRGPGRLLPVAEPHAFDLGDLLGVDRPLERLVRNTEQFVRGLPFNHVLLHGERGTGKSSAVKGLLGRYAGRGLRLVEVRRHDLADLPRVVEALSGIPRPFLIYCDDLAFEEGESGYRELKAALEGSVEAPPANVCIVATSNRRHLIPERRSDNAAARLDEQGDLHLGEALEEKLALSDRFGLVLGFFGFDQPTYLSIVEHYAKKAGLEIAPERLRKEALRWALDRSSRSGRTARQFVDDMAGQEALER